MQLQELPPDISTLKVLFNSSFPDFELIRDVIAKGNYSPDDLALAFAEYLDYNMWEYGDLLKSSDSPSEEEIKKLHTASVPEIVEILLDNHVNLYFRYDEMTILELATFVDIPSILPKLIKMILENGFDANMVQDYETYLEFLDSEISFSLMEEDYHYRVESLFITYIVAIGYGCVFSDGSIPIEVSDGFDISNFRNYQDYGVEPFKEDGRILYRYYEKTSHTIVAIY